MKKLVIALLCVLAMGMLLTGCSAGNTPKELRMSKFPRQNFMIGCNEEEFWDSIKEASVVIRYKNNTTSASIALDDSRLSVSGFSSETAGAKHITITHISSKLTAQYIINIIPITIDSFEITRNPGTLVGEDWVEVDTYYADVVMDEIVFTGGEITITNNDSSKIEHVAMTSENMEVVALQPFTRNNEQLANVSVRLWQEIDGEYVNTNLVETYEIKLIPIHNISAELIQSPSYRFYTSDVTANDIDKRGLAIKMTRNSGKTYTVFDLTTVTHETILEDNLVTLAFPTVDGYIEVSYNIFFLEMGILVQGYADANLDWENFTAINANDASQAIAAFASIVQLTTSELATYTRISAYLNEIVRTAFYVRMGELLSLEAEIKQLDTQSQEYTNACLAFNDLYEELDNTTKNNFNRFKDTILFGTTKVSAALTSLASTYVTSSAAVL